MPGLRIYSRRGCHLCEQLIEELLPLVERRLSVTVCDIDSRDDWRCMYDERVPVVEYDARIVCEGRLDAAAVTALVTAVEAARSGG